MSKFASFLSGNIVAVGAAAAVAVAVVAAVALGVFSSPEPDPVPETTPPVASAPAEPEAQTLPESEDAVPAEAETEVVEAEPEPEAAPAIVPGFDVVRVEPDGSTLVAGKGAPDGDLRILLDGAEIAAVTIDGSGKFVSFIDIEPADQPRFMSLLHKAEDGDVASTATIIIAAAPKPVEVAEQTEAEVADATETEASDPEAADTELAEATEDSAETAEPETAATETEEPTTPTVLLADDDGVTVLQAPSDNSPEVNTTVALDAISYSEEGEVQLSGRSVGEGFVRVYLDNAPVTTSRIEQDGNWRTELPDVDTGVYTLRVDEVNEEGTVVSRVETPFKRESQEALESVTEPEQASAKVVTVQPGSTLWAIANERYGSGVLYVRVFEANKDRIRDPDLIYPGQVFSLPEE